MKNKPDQEKTVRDVIAPLVEMRKIRSSIYEHDLIDLPLKDAVLDRKWFIRRLKELPKVGVKTAEIVDRLLQEQAVLLANSETVGGNQADVDASFGKQLQTAIKSFERTQVQFNAVSGTFFSAAMTASDRHPFWLLEKMKDASVYYLANTIPDVFKTTEVWQAEHGKEKIGNFYRHNLQSVANLASQSVAKIDFVINSSVWEMLIARQGIYSILSDTDVEKQIKVLESVSRQLSGRISFSEANFQVSGLSNCLVAEKEFISTYIFGGYYVSRDIRLISHVLDLITRAEKKHLCFGASLKT